MRSSLARWRVQLVPGTWFFGARLSRVAARSQRLFCWHPSVHRCQMGQDLALNRLGVALPYTVYSFSLRHLACQSRQYSGMWRLQPEREIIRRWKRTGVASLTYKGRCGRGMDNGTCSIQTPCINTSCGYRGKVVMFLSEIARINVCAPGLFVFFKHRSFG